MNTSRPLLKIRLWTFSFLRLISTPVLFHNWPLFPLPLRSSPYRENCPMLGYARPLSLSPCLRFFVSTFKFTPTYKAGFSLLNTFPKRQLFGFVFTFFLFSLNELESTARLLLFYPIHAMLAAPLIVFHYCVHTLRFFRARINGAMMKIIVIIIDDKLSREADL